MIWFQLGMLWDANFLTMLQDSTNTGEPMLFCIASPDLHGLATQEPQQSSHPLRVRSL